MPEGYPKTLKGLRYNAVQWLATISQPAISSIEVHFGTAHTVLFRLERLNLPRVIEFSCLHSSDSENLSLLTEHVSDEIIIDPCSVDSVNIQLLSDLEIDELIIDSSSLMGVPLIESFSLTIGKPTVVGKKFESTPEQLNLSIDQNGRMDNNGPTRNSSPKLNRPQPRDRRPIYVDIFDLILPILQPKFIEGPNKNPLLPDDLKPWQPAGINFLIKNNSALLADEVGLGKTIQTIVALKILFQQGTCKTGLIICKKSLLSVWDRELDKWAPELNVVVVQGGTIDRPAFWDTRSHLHIVSYETYTRDAYTNPIGSLPERQYDICVLDEIQRIKNVGQALKACRRLHAEYRWGLSATPLENSVGDVLNIFSFLKPGLFRSADYDEKHVKSKIEPYVLRRRAKGLPGLPEVQYDKTYLDLLPKQREAYDRAEKDGIIHLKELGNDVSVQHIFQLITALKMICNIEDQSGESSKLDYLHDILEEIVEQGDKALVFSQYSAGSLRKIRSRLEKFSPQLFDGSLSLAERDRVVREFQNLEESKVLLMTFGAGGVGLTLTRANYVFHFDHWWNPAVMDQAAGRAARLGQEKTVFVKSLIIRNSIDEKIQTILEKKKLTFDRTINDLTDEDIQARLTEEDLLGLFGLTKKPASTTKSKSFLDDISPEGFEKLIRDLYERMGYNAKLTKSTGDHGIDVDARKYKADGSMEKIVIQCKHYPNGTVGEPVARDLWGAISSDNLISQGVIVTSGNFSRQCMEFVADKRIMLIDQKKLAILLSQYSIHTS